MLLGQALVDQESLQGNLSRGMKESDLVQEPLCQEVMETERNEQNQYSQTAISC